MATTSPDNIRTPDAGDQYALVQDLGAMADSTQSALNKRANSYRGTSAQRSAFSTAPEGTHWQDTNGSKFEYVRQGGAWVQWGKPPTAGLTQLFSSPGIYMQDTQTATLSSPISSQTTGIILSWSGYTNGAPTNTNWNHVVIPKSSLLLPGAGHNMLLVYGQGSVIGRKYIYVENNSLRGAISNREGDNTFFVLRAVWGF